MARRPRRSQGRKKGRPKHSFDTIYSWEVEKIGDIDILEDPLQQKADNCSYHGAARSSYYRSKIKYARRGQIFRGKPVIPAPRKGDPMYNPTTPRLLNWTRNEGFEMKGGGRNRIRSFQPIDVRDTRNLLRELRRGPFIGVFEICPNMDQKDGSKVYMPRGQADGSHCVVIVGYGRWTRTYKNGRKKVVYYWIYENSWGKEWGKLKGMGRLDVRGLAEAYAPNPRGPPPPPPPPPAAAAPAVA